MSARHPRRNQDPSGPPATPAVPAQRTPIEPESGPLADRLAYSVDEAARLTGLSRDLLYDEMRRGHLDYIKIGRRRLITRRHLEQFLDSATRPAPPAGTTGRTRS